MKSGKSTWRYELKYYGGAVTLPCNLELDYEHETNSASALATYYLMKMAMNGRPVRGSQELEDQTYRFYVRGQNREAIRRSGKKAAWNRGLTIIRELSGLQKIMI